MGNESKNETRYSGILIPILNIDFKERKIDTNIRGIKTNQLKKDFVALSIKGKYVISIEDPNRNRTIIEDQAALFKTLVFLMV